MTSPPDKTGGLNWDEVSTVKVHELVLLNGGEPLSPNASVTRLSDNGARSDGGSKLTVVTVPFLAMEGVTCAPFNVN